MGAINWQQYTCGAKCFLTAKHRVSSEWHFTDNVFGTGITIPGQGSSGHAVPTAAMCSVGLLFRERF
jgi:hypothetical protein